MIDSIKSVLHYSKYIWVFILLIFVHIIVNTIWHTLNNAPITWDPAAHSWISLKIADTLSSGKLLDIFYVSNYYPIFVHTCTSLFILLAKSFSHDGYQLIKIIQSIGTLYFILTLIVIFLWIRNRFSEKTAFFATSFFSFFPIAFGQSHYFMLDLPSVGLFFATLYFLDISDYFQKKRETILFFIFASLLVMTKWVGVIYLLIPAIFFVVTFFKKLKNRSIQITKSLLQKIIVGIVLSCIIVLPWYLINIHSLEFLGGINVIGERGADPANLFSLENILQYMYIFVFTQVTPIPALFFLISFVISFFVSFKHKWYLLSLIIGNYFIFTFISNKDARYTLFMLPFVAVFMTEVFTRFRIKKVVLTNYFLYSLLVFLFGYFLVLSLRPTFLEGYKTPITIPFFGLTHPIDIRNYLVDKYGFDDWMIPTILGDLKKLQAPESQLIVVSELMYLNASNLQAYKLASGIENVMISTPDTSVLVGKYGDTQFPSLKEMTRYLSGGDYVLIPKNTLGPEYVRNLRALKQIQGFIQQNELLYCNDFQQKIAEPGSTCFIKEGETLGSGSDVLVDDHQLLTEEVSVSGPAKVFCEWGCSFSTIERSEQLKEFITFRLLKEYTLLDGQKIQLYQVNN